MSLAEEDFSLPELVDNLLTITKPAIDEHKHQLECNPSRDRHSGRMGPDRQGSRGTLRGAAQDRPRLFCGDSGLEDAGSEWY